MIPKKLLLPTEALKSNYKIKTKLFRLTRFLILKTQPYSIFASLHE